MQHTEKAQIGYVVERLTKRHPELPAETVASVVQRTHESFADASVRDFVPVLVERRAASELSAAPPTTG